MHKSFKPISIGLFFIVSITLLLSLIFFLHPITGNSRQQTLYVRFANINKINIGTRVLLGGKPIGEVEKIEEIPHARNTQPSDKEGNLYFYQLTLKLTSKASIYTTDVISTQTTGLFGEKCITITPKIPNKDEHPILITEKNPVYASSTDTMEELLNNLSSTSEKIHAIATMTQKWFIDNQDHITIALYSFEQTMTQISAITSYLALGEGTVGKFLTSDNTYLQLTAILKKIDTLLNDLNHYGLLFHLNKKWQRLQENQKSLKLSEGYDLGTNPFLPEKKISINK
jgi:phospholipid/cholesterol/gamma-HCH transport system substrate-binding protein